MFGDNFVNWFVVIYVVVEIVFCYYCVDLVEILDYYWFIEIV